MQKIKLKNIKKTKSNQILYIYKTKSIKIKMYTENFRVT